MSEDTILVVKWLESPDGELWSQLAHTRIKIPLFSVIPDGYDSQDLEGLFSPDIWAS